VSVAVLIRRGHSVSAGLDNFSVAVRDLGFGLAQGMGRSNDLLLVFIVIYCVTDMNPMEAATG